MQSITTLVDLLRWRASAHPHYETYGYVRDSNAEWSYLSNAMLDHRARMIGALLQSLGAAGQRVLLVYPPGLEFLSAFFGCLYAGSIAVPVYPPSPGRTERSMPRLRSIVNNCQPFTVLTTADSLNVGAELVALDPAFADLSWYATDDLEDDLAEMWSKPAIDSATLAFLQYTSGSTAAPKGVMVSHSNLLHNMEQIRRKFEIVEDEQSTLWLPFYHDMGLIGGLLEALYCSYKVCLMAPISFLRSPVRWLRLMSETRATIGGSPNFGYELCIRRVTPEQIQSLDLSNWRIAFNGAEPVRSETLERFAQTFAPAGFRPEKWYPCYGLAESTLFVAGGKAGQRPAIRAVTSAALEQHRVVEANQTDADARSLVSLGQIAPGLQAVIVNPETCQPCTSDQIGEVWVSGGSVAQGYWNAPKQTQETFCATLETSPGRSFLRTGDLGFMCHGELYITGRLKDLIIIDGRNHYPQDIEQTVEQCHPAIRSGGCGAFSIDLAGQERLVIVAELQRGYHSEQGKAALSGSENGSTATGRDEILHSIRNAVVNYHDIQVHTICFLKPGSLPKTSSGKIQRHACRDKFLTGTLEVLE